MRTTFRTLAALILSIVVLTGLAAPSASAAAFERPVLEQPAPFNPNPFRSLFRYLKRLIGMQPNDGGQVSPPHP